MILSRFACRSTLYATHARLASTAAVPAAKKWTATYKSRSATIATKTPLITPVELENTVAEGEKDGVNFDAEPLPEILAPITTTTTATTKDYPSIPFPIASNIVLGEKAEIPTEQREIDWATSYHGISTQPFSERAATVLMRELKVAEIEIKPDGLLYLPEILYRRKLNEAFGPGGWGMVPRGEMTVTKMMVSREWGLIAGGRLVSVARGEQTFFDPSGLPTATEGCKSNALMRCCKDLGIASELWDPSFIRVYKNTHCVEAWTEHVSTKKKQKRWRKKGNKFEYPLKEATM